MKFIYTAVISVVDFLFDLRSTLRKKMPEIPPSIFKWLGNTFLKFGEPFLQIQYPYDNIIPVPMRSEIIPEGDDFRHTLFISPLPFLFWIAFCDPRRNNNNTYSTVN